MTEADVYSFFSQAALGQSPDMRLSHNGGLTPTQRLLVRSQVFNSLPDCVHRPWHYPQVRAHFGLYKLEDVICQRVLTLTPQQFNRFAKEKGWS